MEYGPVQRGQGLLSINFIDRDLIYMVLNSGAQVNRTNRNYHCRAHFIEQAGTNHEYRTKASPST